MKRSLFVFVIGCVLSGLSTQPLLASYFRWAGAGITITTLNNVSTVVDFDEWHFTDANGNDDASVSVALLEVLTLNYLGTVKGLNSGAGSGMAHVQITYFNAGPNECYFNQTTVIFTALGGGQLANFTQYDGGQCTPPYDPGRGGCIGARAPTGGGRRPYMSCSCGDCEYDPCCGNSPILIDLDGGRLRLTGANDPVRFDLNANGSPEATGWTERDTKTAFLVFDLNGDGNIDSGRELFGNYSPMPDGTKAKNGYVALAVYDDPASGGNGDGRISAEDAIYPKLQLWIDTNHNGRTDAGELVSLEDAGVESIDLRYREEKKVDRWGNAFRYRSSATLVNDRGRRRHVDTYDVYFVKVSGQ